MQFEEKVLLITMALLAFLFSRVPCAGIFLRTLNTLFHEVGHAIAAHLTSGKVLRIDLFSDTSGSTITQSGSKREQVLVALAGYFFASFVFVLFLLLIRLRVETILNILIVATFALSLVYYVRNTFGIIWLLLMLALYFALYYLVPHYSWIAVYVFAGILWWESVYSSLVIFLLALRDSAAAGDATNLARLTGLPAFFWGLVFLAQAVFFSYIAFKIIG